MNTSMKWEINISLMLWEVKRNDPQNNTKNYGLNPVHHEAVNDWENVLKIIEIESGDNFSSKLKFTIALKIYSLNKYNLKKNGKLFTTILLFLSFYGSNSLKTPLFSLTLSL